MLKSNRDRNYCLRDHVNHQGKFCFNINWTNNSTLNILIGRVLQIKQRVLLRAGSHFDISISISRHTQKQ